MSKYYNQLAADCGHFDYDLMKHKKELSGGVSKKTEETQERILSDLKQVFARINKEKNEEEIREITDTIDSAINNPRINPRMKRRVNMENLKPGDAVIALTAYKTRPVIVIENRGGEILAARLVSFDFKSAGRIQEESRVYYTSEEIAFKKGGMKTDGFIDCDLTHLERIPADDIFNRLPPVYPDIQLIKFEETKKKIEKQRKIKEREKWELTQENQELRRKLVEMEEKYKKLEKRYRYLYNETCYCGKA